MKKNSINVGIKHAKSICEKIRLENRLPFVEILPVELINKRIENINYRERIFSPDMTIFAFLSQVMGADQSCQSALAQVIAHLASQGKEAPSANTAAYCKARERLPEEVLSGLAKESAEELEKAVKKGWLWRGRHLKLVDGTTVSMEDTMENQAEYPQPDSQKKGWDFHWHEWLGYFHYRPERFLI